jgi:peptide/nickel transport system permease protein
MIRLVARRLLAVVPVLVGVSVVAFLLMKLIPGDAAQVIAGPSSTREEVEGIRQALGLHLPLHEQYLRWAWRALHGDLGRSYEQQAPVLGLLLAKFQNTLLLTAAGLFLSFTFGILAGVISAVWPRSAFDRAVMALSLFGNSMPSFWLGLMLMVVLAMWLGWFPSTGMYSLRGPAGPADLLWHLTLPAVTLGAVTMAITARMTRSSMLEVVRQEYVTAARSRGLPGWWVIGKHALRNALLPVVTVMGLQVGYLLGGAVLTETVFAWPGLGLQMYRAISTRDFPLVQGGVLLVATTFVLVNMLVDLIYLSLDPRIRVE